MQSLVYIVGDVRSSAVGKQRGHNRLLLLQSLDQHFPRAVIQLHELYRFFNNLVSFQTPLPERANQEMFQSMKLPWSSLKTLFSIKMVFILSKLNVRGRLLNTSRKCLPFQISPLRHAMSLYLRAPILYNIPNPNVPNPK